MQIWSPIPGDEVTHDSTVVGECRALLQCTAVHMIGMQAVDYSCSFKNVPYYNALPKL